MQLSASKEMITRTKSIHRIQNTHKTIITYAHQAKNINNSNNMQLKVTDVQSDKTITHFRNKHDSSEQKNKLLEHLRTSPTCKYSTNIMFFIRTLVYITNENTTTDNSSTITQKTDA